MTKGFWPLLVAALAFSAPAFAGTITIDFEQYSQPTQITNQYAATDDVTFTNAEQLVAPNYNNIAFPPHSGNGVIFNYPNAGIVMTFTPGFGSFSVSAWYTVGDELIATAYDAGGNVLQTVDGAGDVGTTKLLSLSGGSTLISEVVFADGDGIPTAFTLDDVTFTPVPEPGTFLPMSLALAVVVRLGFLRRRRV